MFDQDGSGSISVNEIRAIFGKAETLDSSVYESVVKECDSDGNGEIDLEEFKSMMLRLF